jgi:hypothetical protein
MIPTLVWLDVVVVEGKIAMGFESGFAGPALRLTFWKHGMFEHVRTCCALILFSAD